MGAVYKAHDVSLDRDVAIKVMHAHFTDDEGFRARFLQEARTIASLNHSGIVQVYAFGQDLELLYIVMDYLPGQNLHDWLRCLADEHKIIALAESLAIVQQVAEALHYAHQKGVLHRDVKPSNIMLKPVDPDLRRPDDMPFHPVLTDFGLAKLAEGGVQTQTGTAMGSPAYMSPEQCLGLEPDRRSDVYSLGIVLFELVTGRVPFEVKSLTEAIRCHTQERPPPPRTVNPTIPVEVENVVLRALAKRREDRFATALEMAGGLGQVLISLPTGLSVALTHDEGPVFYESLMTRLTQGGVVQPPPGIAEGPGTRCRSCGNTIPPGRGFCGRCGSPVQRPSVGLCPNCGRQNPAGDRFCGRCGARLAGEDASPIGQLGSSLVVLSPDGESRRFPLEGKRTLTVGRGEGNDVRLDDPEASRRHARIESDGERFTVTDLESTNGTFLGESRLLPGVSQPWPSGVRLHIGDHQLTFEVQTGLSAAPGGSTLGLSAVSAHTAVRTAISLEPAGLEVQAGQSVTARVNISNQGIQVDHFRVSVSGIPSDWVSDLPPVIRLLPGEEHGVELTFRPPRSPQSRAGLHPLAVLVTSQQDAHEVAEARGTLTIVPYYDLSAELNPQKQSGTEEGTFRVRIRNQGNARGTVSLQATDPEEGCTYAFTSPQIVVPAGEERVVQLRVRPKAPLRGMASKRYPFTIMARLVESPELSRQVQGEWTQIAPAFEVSLSPQAQSGTTGGTYSVWIDNREHADLAIELDATDPEGACLFTCDPPQVVVPAGQNRVVRLRVQPRSSSRSQEATTYSFTVVARPARAPQWARRVQGQWTRLPPPPEIIVPPPERVQPVPQVVTPPPAPKPVPPASPPASPARQPVDLPKPRRLWGCVVGLISLALTFGAGIGTAALMEMNLDYPTSESAGIIGAGILWLVGLIVTIVLTRKVRERKQVGGCLVVILLGLVILAIVGVLYLLGQ
jgi:hypothetical protein